MVGFRQTENAIVVRTGTGVWKTATALGKIQRRYLDPVSGQAGFVAVSWVLTRSALAGTK